MEINARKIFNLNDRNTIVLRSFKRILNTTNFFTFIPLSTSALSTSAICTSAICTSAISSSAVSTSPLFSNFVFHLERSFRRHNMMRVVRDGPACWHGSLSKFKLFFYFFFFTKDPLREFPII